MIPTLQLGGLGRPIKRASSGATYLDSLATPPRACLSLRKLISTATVSVRVRRSSDNAEQDIGFSGNALDTASLAAFVGANSAFVVTFYDQTGNGEHATQATAANQPRLVNAGVYDGKLVFDGSNDAMTITALAMGAPHAGLYGKWALPDAAGPQIAFETSTNYNSNVGALIYYMDADLHRFGLNGGVPWRRDFDPASLTALTQVTLLGQMAVADGTTPQQRMWVNGSAQAVAGSQGTPATPPVNFVSFDAHLGARAGSSFFAPLQLETLAIYNADSSGIRASIEAIVA